MSWEQRLSAMALRQSSMATQQDEMALSLSTIEERMERWEERVTGAPRVIDADHAYIHDGAAFSVSVNATAAAGANQFVIHTPATLYVHFRPTWLTIDEGEVIFSIYEDATSTGGLGWTDATPINRSRVSTSTAESVFYDEGTTSTGGDLIDQFAVFGVAGPGQTRGGAGRGEPLEWVLAQDTQYRIVVDTTERFYAQMFWYEETEG